MSQLPKMHIALDQDDLKGNLYLDETKNFHVENFSIRRHLRASTRGLGKSGPSNVRECIRAGSHALNGHVSFGGFRIHISNI